MNTLAYSFSLLISNEDFERFLGVSSSGVYLYEAHNYVVDDEVVAGHECE